MLASLCASLPLLSFSVTLKHNTSSIIKGRKTGKREPEQVGITLCPPVMQFIKDHNESPRERDNAEGGQSIGSLLEKSSQGRVMAKKE